MPPRRRKPDPYAALEKERKLNRRAFLGLGAITAAGGILSFLKLSKKPEVKPSKPIQMKMVVEKKPEREPKKPKPRPKPAPKPGQNFMVYREGLKGEAFAKAYGVPFTRNVFDLNKIPANLVHDVKVLVTRECAKYNKVCEVNPKGIQIVDPHEILAVIEHESHYNPNARGKAGDAGFGQLMPSQIETLKKFSKMPIIVSDPYDPAQNITGIVRTFVWFANHPANKEKSTTWRRFASYNAGRGGAKDKIILWSRRYANTLTAIWKRMQDNKELANYIN
ncbi:MAG: lytic transglycosylase domain-containing protein [Candidatus Diapherotrites archaeon]